MRVLNSFFVLTLSVLCIVGCNNPISNACFNCLFPGLKQLDKLGRICNNNYRRDFNVTEQLVTGGILTRDECKEALKTTEGLVNGECAAQCDDTAQQMNSYQRLVEQFDKVTQQALLDGDEATYKHLLAERQLLEGVDEASIDFKEGSYTAGMTQEEQVRCAEKIGEKCCRWYSGLCGR